TENALHVLDSGRLREFVHDHMGRDRVRDVPTLAPPFVERLGRDALVERFSDPAVRRRLADALRRQTNDLRLRLGAVNVVERLWLSEELKQASRLLEPGRGVDLTGFDLGDFLEAAHDAESRARHPEPFRADTLDPGGPALVPYALLSLVICPVCWV